MFQLKKRGNDDENQILKFRVLEERVALHGPGERVCRSPLAAGIPDPSAEGWHFALTTITVCHPQLEKEKNPSVIVDCIEQPQEQTRAEFPHLHNLCPPFKKLVLPEMLSQAGNAQRDDHNGEHEPAECRAEPQREDVPV